MLKIINEENKEQLILKEDKPITLTEVGTGIKRKLLLENKENEQPTSYADDFLNIIICLSDITRRFAGEPRYSENQLATIEIEKQLIIQAMSVIDAVELDRINREESYKTGNKKKLIKEGNKEQLILKEDKQSTFWTEDFFNIIICLTSITRRLTEILELEEKDTSVIEEQKQAIITAIAMITDTLNLDEELSYNEVKTEKKKKLIKEEIKPVEYLEYDVIPLLRFTEIEANLNTVIKGYDDVAENLTYEKTKEIATDLTRIENAIDNIATLLSNELANNLIYKEG